MLLLSLLRPSGLSAATLKETRYNACSPQPENNLPPPLLWVPVIVTTQVAVSKGKIRNVCIERGTSWILEPCAKVCLQAMMSDRKCTETHGSRDSMCLRHGTFNVFVSCAAVLLIDTLQTIIRSNVHRKVISRRQLTKMWNSPTTLLRNKSISSHCSSS